MRVGERGRCDAAGSAPTPITCETAGADMMLSSEAGIIGGQRRFGKGRSSRMHRGDAGARLVALARALVCSREDSDEHGPQQRGAHGRDA